MARPRAASLHRLARTLGVEATELAALLGWATEPDIEQVASVRLRIGSSAHCAYGTTTWNKAIPSAMQRLLLGPLATQPGRTIGVAEIVDLLWGGGPPLTGSQLVQTYVGQLCSLRH